MALEDGSTLQILFYVALFGVGSIVSIGVPVGIMVFNAILDRKRTKKSVPIVLRMFTEDGSYEELIGIPHDMVVQFLEATYNVKIETNKPKPRPPDSDLIKWLGHSMTRGPKGASGTQHLNLQVKDYMPYYKPKRHPQVQVTELLSKLEDYRR